MSQTSFQVGDPGTLIKQSIGLFRTNQKRKGVISYLSGPMPKMEGDKAQSSAEYPIVKALDLGRGIGDTVTFDLINPMQALPTMGDDTLQGKGSAISLTQDRLVVNQHRFAVNAGGAMSQNRTMWDMRTIARGETQKLIDRYADQLPLVHMCGARGSLYNNHWTIPLESHAQFSSIIKNPLRAPAKIRHFMSTGSSIEPFTVSGGEVQLATTDIFNKDVVDSVKAYLEMTEFQIPNIIIDGDKSGYDDPMWILLVSPDQYAAFQQDSAFRTFQSYALARANVAGQHPLFMGQVGLWQGILIRKMPYPIRFYSGDTIKYCASSTSTTESSATVPAALGAAGYCVDRAILLGGQALAQAMAKHGFTGAPIFFNEEWGDHKNTIEYSVAMVDGVSKVRFSVKQPGGETVIVDHGVTVIDTAVKMTQLPR